MTDATVPTAVGQVALLVRDVEARIAFYRDTLGLEHFGTWGDLVFFKARPGCTAPASTRPRGSRCPPSTSPSPTSMAPSVASKRPG